MGIRRGIITTMTKDAKKILSEAMVLSENDRALLAASLIDSLDELIDPDVEDAWELEIQKRSQELSGGKVKGTAWIEARKILLESIE